MMEGGRRGVIKTIQKADKTDGVGDYIISGNHRSGRV